MRWLLASTFVAGLFFCSLATGGQTLTLGIHAHDPSHVAAAAKTGYSVIRLWDTGTDWSSLKPQPDQWKFERIDAYLAASEKAKLKVLWTIGNTPRWASARPGEACAYGLGCASEPRDLEEWRRYVRIIATTYRGRIECYEPWNEVSFPTDPSFEQPGSGGEPQQFFSGSVEAMVNLSRIAYEEIKRVDPGACVLSPSFHSTGNWALKFDRYLAAGGGKYFDAVSQHFYFGEEPERVVSIIQAMRSVMSKHGISKPVWNTEVGISFEAQSRNWQGMQLKDFVYAITLRSYLLNASEGVSRVYWYAWDNKGMGFFQPSTSVDFGSAAASAAVHLLDGLESVRCQVKGVLWQCQVTAGARRFKVVWLAGRKVIPVSVKFQTNATRWGSPTETFPAGQEFFLDGRPVIVDGEN